MACVLIPDVELPPSPWTGMLVVVLEEDGTAHFTKAQTLERKTVKYTIGEIGTIVPAADVRPVVTCGECKHWETDWTPRGVSDGRHYCAPLDVYPSADWFCADGAKREES